MTTIAYKDTTDRCSRAGLPTFAFAALVCWLTNATAASAPDPVFSPKGGIYTNEMLTVSLSTPSGTIHLTLDGTEPTEASAIYTTALTITNSALLKTRVFEPGLEPSRIVAHAYHLVGSGFTNFSSNLPLLTLNTFGREIVYSPRLGLPGTLASLVLIDVSQVRSSLGNIPGLLSGRKIHETICLDCPCGTA